MYDPVIWRHRTNQGRVVYDREKKPFTLKDIERVIRRLPRMVDALGPSDPDTIYWIVRRFLESTTRAIGEWVSNTFFQGRISEDNMRRVLLDGITMLLSFLGVPVQKINDGIGDFLRSLDPPPAQEPVFADPSSYTTAYSEWEKRFQGWYDRWKRNHFGQPPSPSDIERYAPKPPRR